MPTKPTTPRRRALPRSEDEVAALKQAIIERLAATGDTIHASATACGVPIGTLYRWRRADSVFKATLKDAYDAGTDVLEQEAIRRGVHGVEKPVFYQGEEISRIREYSDVLLMFVLKKRNPAFRENTPGLDAKDPAPPGSFHLDAEMLDAFSPQLRALLRKEAEELRHRRQSGLPLIQQQRRSLNDDDDKLKKGRKPAAR